MMTLVDVAAARKTMLQTRQSAYEVMFVATQNRDTATLALAKRSLQDTLDEEDQLNQITGLISVIAALP